MRSTGYDSSDKVLIQIYTSIVQFKAQISTFNFPGTARNSFIHV